MKKWGLYIVMICYISGLRGQDKGNPWLVKLGVNYTKMNELVGWTPTFASPSITGYRHLHDGISVGLKINISSQNTPEDPPNDQANYIDVEAMLKYSVNKLIPMGNFDPYLAIGIGHGSTSFVGTIKTSLTTGLQYWVASRYGVWVGASYQNDFLKKRLTSYEASAGIIIKLGSKDSDGDGVYNNQDVCPYAKGLEEYRGCPDSDGDGVADIKDDCPLTAGEIFLSGCPDKDEDRVPDNKDKCPDVKGGIAFSGCPDTDKDGVIDGDDECPEEAGAVENYGCPWPDIDQDGVPDIRDECIAVKGTIANDGCPENLSKQAILDVNYWARLVKFENAEITDNSLDLIDRMIDVLSAYILNKPIKITVYSNDSSNVQQNKELAEERAKTIKYYFVTGGLDRTQIMTSGEGTPHPILPKQAYIDISLVK